MLAMGFLDCILPALRLYLLGLRVLINQLLCRPFTLPELALQHGRVAIVTGGARGIGYETARHMASLGAHVIIAGQNELEGVSAVKKICEENREAKVEFEQLDLASLQSVRQFVQTFKRRCLPLHILVNNAAVMLVPEGRTEEGFERHFGVNYLGHFLLTLLLLDTLKHSGKRGSCSRVVTLSSSAHGAGEIQLDNLLNRQCYSAHAAYCQSKLALLLFSSHLQQRLDRGGFSVSSCAVDPGMVDTSLYRHLFPPARLAQTAIARLLFRSPTQGASTVLYTALSPSLEGEGGGYWSNGRTEMTSPNTYDPQLQLGLWDSSCRLVGLQEQHQP
ncbi:dehydrogenase/reductase SDR family member on chromosome X isoform X2 [Coregonus clupeaformis]|uniref:dehydrogenase/reductase SDR family member on chromosome X isoform X2 n=1 Tax=Coregonus clupeaformis TaxID=59861 RepID=UPI001BDFFDF7|nr:dehydrogenase/reductase SDR family member on chromosome X isoform X2 [Coregonus clupeaformis]